jgi:tRNA dimethylallyltransferase
LAEIDPVSAARIDSRNVRRVVRALEIHRLTNQPPSRLRQRTETPFRSLKIVLSLPRGELYARIDNRLERMVERGLVDEVRRLLARGFSPDLPAMSAIGYRQIVAYLQGKIALEEALAEIRRASRRLVRHQANWFKEDDPENHVFEAGPGVEEGIVELIQRWLGDEIMD